MAMAKSDRFGGSKRTPESEMRSRHAFKRSNMSETQVAEAEKAAVVERRREILKKFDVGDEVSMGPKRKGFVIEKDTDGNGNLLIRTSVRDEIYSPEFLDIARKKEN